MIWAPIDKAGVGVNRCTAAVFVGVWVYVPENAAHPPRIGREFAARPALSFIRATSERTRADLCASQLVKSQSPFYSNRRRGGLVRACRNDE